MFIYYVIFFMNLTTNMGLYISSSYVIRKVRSSAAAFIREPSDSGDCIHPCFSSKTCGAFSRFFTYHRLQPSLYRIESKEDLSYTTHTLYFQKYSLTHPNNWNPMFQSLPWPQVYKTKHQGMQTVSTNICERMGRSQELSEFQSGTVIGCHLCNKSSREISSLLNIPQSTVVL